MFTVREVRDALATVGITGPVAARLTDELNRLLKEKEEGGDGTTPSQQAEQA